MTQERSSVFEVSYVGAELPSAPGTAVAANKKLEAIGLQIKPTGETERFRAFGDKYDTMVIPGKEWTAVDVKGRLDYNNIVYALASVLNSPEIVDLGTGTDEVETLTITGTPTGGSYTLTYGGQTTAAIPYNATAANVQAALEAITTVGLGNVLCGGGPHPGTAITVTFRNALGKLNVTQMTATGSFTGGTSPAIAVTTTTPGVTSDAREWTFTSSPNSPDLLQTFTVDSGSPVRAQRASGVQLNDLSFSFKRSGIDLSGSGMGQLFQDNVYMTGNAVYTLTIAGTVTGGYFTLTYSGQTTSPIAYNATADQVYAALAALSNIGPSDVVVLGGPGATTPYIIVFTGLLGNQAITLTATLTTLTPSVGTSAIATTQEGQAITVVKAKPVLPGAINIYVDSSAGSLGTSKELRVFQADLKIGSRYNTMWVLNSAVPSYAATVETAPDVTLQLKMAANGAGMRYLNNFRNGEPVYVRIQSTGPALPAPDAASNYLFRLDMASQVEKPNDMPEVDGAMAVDWTFRAVNDASFGKAIQAFVRNITRSL